MTPGLWWIITLCTVTCSYARLHVEVSHEDQGPEIETLLQSAEPNKTGCEKSHTLAIIAMSGILLEYPIPPWILPEDAVISQVSPTIVSILTHFLDSSQFIYPIPY